MIIFSTHALMHSCTHVGTDLLFLEDMLSNFVFLGGGGYSFVACLSCMIIDHIPCETERRRGRGDRYLREMLVILGKPTDK